MSPGLIEFPGGISTDQGPSVFNVDALWVSHPSELPQTPRLRTVPLPPVGTGYDDGSHFGGNGSDDEGDDDFPGYGLSEYQPTPEWLDTSSYGDEGLMGLATAKPKIEDNSQSEVRSAFYSVGGYPLITALVTV